MASAPPGRARSGLEFAGGVSMCSSVPAARLLIVDDDPSLHEDYSRCLAPAPVDREQLDAARATLFGPSGPAANDTRTRFQLAHAYDGTGAAALVRKERDSAEGFSVAFVDMRMPPGWSGVETIGELWKIDAAIQVVLCTAFSDFTWDKVIAALGRSDGLHLLRKPFSQEQVRRFAEVLAKKWQLAHAAPRRAASEP